MSDRPSIFRKTVRALPPLLLFLTLAPGAGAAEFTAELWIQEGEKTIPAKLSVKNGKKRHEFLDEEGHTVTIVRPDKKVIWVLLADKKLYMEMPLMSKLPGHFLQVPPDALSKRKVGVETVNGYQAEKLEVMVRSRAGGATRQTYWVSEKLGLPIKMVWAERGLTVEYRAIKEGKVADRLFEIPPGFQKQAEPSGAPLQRWD